MIQSIKYILEDFAEIQGFILGIACLTGCLISSALHIYHQRLLRKIHRDFTDTLIAIYTTEINYLREEIRAIKDDSEPLK